MEVRFDLPDYSLALRELFMRAVEAVHNSDPFLGMMPIRHIVHSGPIRNIPGPEPLDQPLELAEQVASIGRETIRETDVEAFTLVLYAFAKGVALQQARHIFRMLDEITQKTGNVISNEGEPITVSRFIDMIEKVEMGFDEEGKSTSAIVVPPALYKQIAELTPTPEEVRRAQEVMRRKKEEHDAKKRTRRLS